MPSSKFNLRPVPRRRPAICASLNKPPPPPPGRPALPAAPAPPYCLPPFDVLCPHTLMINFGWVDLDPLLPPQEHPRLCALERSDPKTGDPPSWHAAHVERPWELHVWVEWEALPGRCAVTLRLWHFGVPEDHVWDPVWYNAFAAFDTRLLTNTVLPFHDYRWARACA